METEATLKEWVRAHKVTWELGSWQELVEHRTTTVGFELRLLARHARDGHPRPGCSECVVVYEQLRELALSAFPWEQSPATYEIEPFDASFHLRPEGGWSPDVHLRVRIVHKAGYLLPVNEGERRCAQEIQMALSCLGVQPETWSATREEASSGS